MKLTLKLIEDFNLKQRVVTPDYDDAGYEFTLPSGIILIGFFMISHEPCETDSLEGMDGYIYIDTVEELEELVAIKSYAETLLWIKKRDKDFDLEEYTEY